MNRSPREIFVARQKPCIDIGIDKTVRDSLQNHALTDFSVKHYDRWDYMPEKCEALLKWAVCLLQPIKNRTSRWRKYLMVKPSDILIRGTRNIVANYSFITPSILILFVMFGG